MLTGKQRAQLRKMANGIDSILQVGKNGVTDTLVRQADDALEARELIKGNVLENSGYDAKRASGELCAATGAESVLIIGSRFVLYRESKNKKTIKLAGQ